MTDIPLGAGAEFDRIRAIARALGPAAAGLGGDCAVIPESPGSNLVLSTDISVENVHFRVEWLSLEEIGWRAAAAALSDLAAAGAGAVGILTALTVPGSAPQSAVVEVMRGAGAAAAAADGVVLGGDLSSGDAWNIAVTVVGRAARPVSRRGAAPDDGVWVTGRLGAARAALEAWRQGREPDAHARGAFAHPAPRISAGRWLAAHGASAMLDLSDGLAGDAGHLAAASDVGLAIDLDLLPVAPAARTAAQGLGVAPARFAAEGGEDYELLATLPAGFASADSFEAAVGIPLTRIGSVRAGSGIRFRLAGADLVLTGFDHFR